MSRPESLRSIRRAPALLALAATFLACAGPAANAPAEPSAAESLEATAEPRGDNGAFSAALLRLREEESAPSDRSAHPSAAPARPWPELTRFQGTSIAAGERPRALAAQVRAAQVPGLVIADEESLRVVVDAVADATGLPLVVSAGAEAAAFDAGAVFDLNLTSPLGARHVLNLVADQAGEEVMWVERHGAVLFVTAQKAAGEKVVRLHDIRRLTFPRTDFTAPRIDRLRLLDELEDDDGGSPFSGPVESVSWFTPDEVLESVVEFVAPTSWEDPGVSIDVIEGGLVVVHTAEVQREVARYLRQLGDG